MSTETFDYKDKELQKFTVPANVTSITINAIEALEGMIRVPSSYGGYGASITGTNVISGRPGNGM